jgi:hypothetical protein
MLHPKLNDCYDDMNRFNNMYISDRINEKQLDKNVHLSIKEFMDENNMKYKID